MTGIRRTATRRRRPSAYVPVYTLHDMHEQTGNTPNVPVVICTGCGHPILAPRSSAKIQCRDCGRKIQVVNVHPATQHSEGV